MPRKKTVKKNPVTKMTTSGRPLTEIQKETILQVYALTGNKSETARQLGVSESTVYKLIAASEKAPVKLREARASAVEQMAGKVHAKADMVLESIGEADLETGRYDLYDEAGNLQRVVTWGPTLLQKVTAVAILADKTRVLSDMREGLRAAVDANPTNMPLPQDVDAAIRQIATKVRRLRLLDVQFDNQIDDDLTKKLQDAVVIAQTSSIEQTIPPEEYTPTDSEVIDEFDAK